MGKKILIIDDEHSILELLKLNLEIYGHEIFITDTGEGVLEKIEEIQPELILLDLMLPKINGFQLCQLIRQNPLLDEVRILVISAKSEEMDKIRCLEIGADDYITKPFSIKELIARIDAFSRRMRNSAECSTNSISYKNLQIDLKEKKIYQNGNIIPLTTLEMKLLLYLIKNHDKVTTRNMIFKEVWNYEENNNTRSLDVNIRKLRKKLESIPNIRIETIRNIGYKLS